MQLTLKACSKTSPAAELTFTYVSRGCGLNPRAFTFPKACQSRKFWNLILKLSLFWDYIVGTVNAVKNAGDLKNLETGS